MNSDYKQKVIRWNNQFPVDYWWRKKHNIAFMSDKHRASNFWDQMFEFYEDTLINKSLDHQEYQINNNTYLKIKDDISLDDVKANQEYALEELKKFKKT